jgi:hypothetical protein
MRWACATSTGRTSSTRARKAGTASRGSPDDGGRYARPYARCGSDVDPPRPLVALADVGKGVQLSVVLASWSLYTVDLKAERTRMFYCTHPTLELHVSDRAQQHDKLRNQ